ncbi:UMP-CMP kinase-like isoform X2 [Dysidea avara]|uniref:UMP-CMP kinase-like isoform X2 n=1 Tax=Dysidea avara TaxID=196820 RepID=UPI00332B8EB9
MAAVKPLVVFVLGGPGAGKGTQCAKIVEEYGFVHLSAGDLLRAERASGSPDGDLIQSCMKEGKIVPVEITVNLIRKAIEASGKGKFLVDGYPRNEDNYTGWEKYMGDRCNVGLVLFFDCPEEVCLERAMKRGQTSGRVDDNIESFRKRYHTYINETMPIVKIYQDKGKLRTISGLPPPDEVFAEVKKIFDKL